MSRSTSPVFAALIAALSLCLAIPAHALAHESRDVAAGKYQMVVGFLVEPAYEGQKNGLDLRVRVPGTPPTPVIGLEKTLQVEMIHVATGKAITKPIRAISATNDPGHYTSDVLPSQAGQYRFRIFGTVDTAQVNESFTSGDKFGNVAPIAELSFPDAAAAGGGGSLEKEVKNLEAAAADAAAAASSARTMAIAALGVAVIAIGAAGVVAMRKG